MDHRPPHKTPDPAQALHAAWLAVMRAQIALSDIGKYDQADELGDVCLHLHGMHESYLKSRGGRVLPFRVPDCSSAQMRIPQRPPEV